jgi:hypothetical protein
MDDRANQIEVVYYDPSSTMPNRRLSWNRRASTISAST